MQKEFQRLYPNTQDIPPDVLERYLSLRDRQLESFKPDGETEQERIAAEIDSFIAEQRAAAEAGKGQEAEPMPAVFRSNRGRLRGDEAAVPPAHESTEPVQEEEKTRPSEVVPFDDIKEILQAKLESNPSIKAINTLEVNEGDDGLHLRIDIDTTGGKAAIKGLVTNGRDGLVINDLEVEANFLVKSGVREAFSDFSAAVKRHFEKLYGQPISSIRGGTAGLTIEFAPPVTAVEPATSEPDDKIEPTLGSESEPLTDISPEPDGTQDWRERWRGKLRGLVGKVVEGTKEKIGMSERGERLKNYLAERSKELSTKAKEYGADPEKLVRDIGEKYSKLSLTKKFLFGFGLGAGATIFSGVSTPLTLLFVGGLGIQRTAGMASAYLTAEKLLLKTKEHFGRSKESDRVDKAMAAFLAVAYTTAATAAIGEAIHYASESSYGEAVHEWLRHHYPFGEAAVPAAAEVRQEVVQPQSAAPAPAAPEVPAAPVSAPEAAVTPLAEVPQPAAAAAAGEAVAPAAAEAPAPAFEIPDVSVEATPGKGYEYMMKRLWEDPRMANLKAEDYFKPGVPPEQQSDIYKLLTADATKIDTVVHQIAADPEHGFFNPDGTSVRIDPSAHLSIDTDGQLHLADAMHPEGVVNAAESMRVMPPLHPEAPAVSGAEAPLPSEEIVSPEPIQPVDLTHAQDAAAVGQPTHEGSILHDSQGQAVIDSQGSPIHTGTLEASPDTNIFGLKVPLTEPHIYTDLGAVHTFVYGGSPVERAKSILEYLTQNPNKVVFAADDSGKYRIPWHLVEGKVTPGAPVQTSGFFGFFSSFMKAPEPDEFEKLIK